MSKGMTQEHDTNPNRKRRGLSKVASTAAMLLLAACSTGSPPVSASDSKSHTPATEHQKPESANNTPPITPEQAKLAKEQLKGPALEAALVILNGLSDSAPSTEQATSVEISNRQSAKSNPGLPQLSIMYSTKYRTLEIAAISTSSSLIAGGQVYSSVRASFKLGSGNPLDGNKGLTKDAVRGALSDTENLEVSQLAVASNQPLKYNPDPRFQSGSEVSIFFRPDGHVVRTGVTSALADSAKTENSALQVDIGVLVVALPQVTKRILSPPASNFQ